METGLKRCRPAKRLFSFGDTGRSSTRPSECSAHRSTSSPGGVSPTAIPTEGSWRMRSVSSKQESVELFLFSDPPFLWGHPGCEKGFRRLQEKRVLVTCGAREEDPGSGEGTMEGGGGVLRPQVEIRRHAPGQRPGAGRQYNRLVCDRLQSVQICEVVGLIRKHSSSVLSMDR